jgi:predicted GIY-YIG superfamily endonuclease
VSVRRLSRRSLGGGGQILKYVYILQSLTAEEHFYTGITDDLHARLAKHNAGAVTHTSKFRPWRIKSYVAFTDEARAIDFEKYLKSGSGRAFAKARL